MYPGRCSVSTCLTSDGWRRCEPLALTHRYLSACRTCLQYWASPILIKLLPLKDYKYMIFFFLPLAVHALCSEGSFLFFFFAVFCYVFCIMIFFFLAVLCVSSVRVFVWENRPTSRPAVVPVCSLRLHLSHTAVPSARHGVRHQSLPSVPPQLCHSVHTERPHT